MHPITTLSPAKINLFLHITGKRADGYHNLQTVFRLISLYDTLTFTKTEQKIGNGDIFVILANTEHITADSNDNLIVKASRALLAFVKNTHNHSIDTLPIIKIALDKKIPMGAGLGGGSSNCATTLMTLNQLWQLGLSNEQLRQIGATLGADVPIFIYGQDAIAEGIGERLTPIKLPPQRFLLLKPNAHINTAKLFAHPDLRRDCPSFSHDYLYSHTDDFADRLSNEFSNVFEPVVRRLSPEVDTALAYLEQLAQHTHTTPRMTGSGSCVFLPLPSDVDKQVVKKWQQQSVCTSFVVQTI